MPEIKFESLGLQEVPNASGKTIQVNRITVPNNSCEGFTLEYVIRKDKIIDDYDPSKDSERKHIPCSVTPKQVQRYMVIIVNSFARVPINEYLYIKLGTKVNQLFSGQAIITYEIVKNPL